MKPIKIVFDTNVYLAATKKGSYARIHLQRVQPNGPYELFISPEIILELRRKLELKFDFSPEESGSFVDMVMMYAKLVQPKRKIKGILRDADDHIILECAVDAWSASHSKRGPRSTEAQELRRDRYYSPYNVAIYAMRAAFSTQG